MCGRVNTIVLGWSFHAGIRVRQIAFVKFAWAADILLSESIGTSGRSSCWHCRSRQWHRTPRNPPLRRHRFRLSRKPKPLRRTRAPRSTSTITRRLRRKSKQRVQPRPPRSRSGLDDDHYHHASAAVIPGSRSELPFMGLDYRRRTVSEDRRRV